MPLYGDVSFSTEGVMVISGLLSFVVGALVFIHKLLMQALRDQIDSGKLEVKSYKEIATEAVRAAETVVTPKLQTPAPVVAEHHSPTTEEQQATADLQTLRARVTAVSLAAGLPPRAAGIAAVVDGEPITKSAETKLLKGIAEVKEDTAVIREEIAKKSPPPE